MSLAIETYSLTKKFIISKSVFSFFPRDKIVACDKISLQINKGELFCLLGPNGAGKTTLMKMLCGLLLPDFGKAYVNGFDISKRVFAIKNSIGLVTGEERSFYWRLTGRENLVFFGALSNIPKKQVYKKIEELDQFLKIGSNIDNLVENYSSGMRQKLAVMRGLINNPDILFLDEPTRSLDHNSSHSLMCFIKDKFVNQDKKTVFICTHQLGEAEEFSDRIVIMDNGRIQFDIRALQLKQHSSSLREIFSQYTSTNNK